MPPETTSFIPKTTVLPKPVYKSRGLGFLTVIAVLLFVLSLGILVGVWLYIGVLQGNFDKLNADFDKTKQEFELGSIQDLSKVAASIDIAKNLLGSHVAVSGTFDFLDKNTLPAVRFINFNYGGGGGNLVALSGESKSFTALAEQALVFESSQYVENISLSNLSLKGGGRVGFDMVITIKPELIKYNQTSGL